MTTLTLQVKDSILEKVLSILSQFDRSEVEVMEQDAAFLAQRKHLHEQIARLERGEAKTYSIEEVEAHLDKVISEYEA
jgi:uncharacterized protein YicC (UPF0701 family)